MRPGSAFTELDKSIHDRGAFACGTEELDAFLQQFAVRHREAGISKTMVLPARDNDADICAYYTLSHTEIERRTLPKTLAKKLLRYPIPVMSIAQLAVHEPAQGLGKVTLIAAQRRAYDVNLHLPSYAVVVDALDDGMQGFYEQYGFEPLDTRNQRTRLVQSKKLATKMVNRIQTVEFPYRTIKNGIFLGNQDDLAYYPLPSREALRNEHYRWWRSANH